MPKAFTRYKIALEEKGVKLLDVYRYKDHEELRVKYPDGTVKIIKIKGYRTSMSPEELVKHVLEQHKR